MYVYIESYKIQSKPSPTLICCQAALPSFRKYFFSSSLTRSADKFSMRTAGICAKASILKSRCHSPSSSHRSSNISTKDGGQQYCISSGAFFSENLKQLCKHTAPNIRPFINLTYRCAKYSPLRNHNTKSLFNYPSRSA